MSGKYVPPSKRAGYKPTTSELPPGHHSRRAQGPSISAVERIFDIRQQGTFNYFAWRPPTEPRRERAPYDPTRTPETTPLPPSPPPPLPLHPLGHLLAYIMIFGNAHPYWETQAELWSHTDAHILIEDEEGMRQNFDRPIPVFANRTRESPVTFEGWWKLDKMRIVPPNSEEVTDLHLTKQRFKGANNTWLRTKTAWQQSLGCTWIKTRFVRVDTSDPRYTDFPDPLSLSAGEGATSVLRAGGMEEELAILQNEVPNLKREIEGKSKPNSVAR